MGLLAAAIDYAGGDETSADVDAFVAEFRALGFIHERSVPPVTTDIPLFRRNPGIPLVCA